MVRVFKDSPRSQASSRVINASLGKAVAAKEALIATLLFSSASISRPVDPHSNINQEPSSSNSLSTSRRMVAHCLGGLAAILLVRHTPLDGASACTTLSKL